jgi:hypothetical protein
MSNTAQTETVPPGTKAYFVAFAQIGKPYAMGGKGPDNFDCSGLMRWAYTTGPGSPGILLGPNLAAHPTVDQIFNNTATLTRVFDVNASVAAGGPSTPDPNTLQQGDMLCFLVAGTTDYGHQHVMMYDGAGNCVQAPYTGANVDTIPLTFDIGPQEPFAGVMRPKGDASKTVNLPNSMQGSNTANSGSWGSMASGSDPVNGQSYISILEGYAKTQPTNNLPFSAMFMDQRIQGQPAGGGGLIVNDIPGTNPGTRLMPSAQLVRGGMGEIVANLFKCYFQMNPQTISADFQVNNQNTSPLELDPSAQQFGGYWVTQDTISFTIYFNRMYEVWQGPWGKGGPADVGCRYDIRALERLMGIFDAQYGQGFGKYGEGPYPPQTIPLQVVFGGYNSFQFQGVIAGFDYTYTIFNNAMIPVECYADIQVMRLYQPNVSADLVNALVNTTNQSGPQKFRTNPLPGNIYGPVQLYTQ